MPLSAGDKLGPFEILAPIGKGGMGEVYRARDTKLDRDVAIKILPEALSRDPERLARFEREAKVLASLNHPNIAQIYGLQDNAIVMELVEGETLKGPIPIDTALNYATQITGALEAAHGKSITHRDLKPANIMITPAGTVKVLDFGLAAYSPDREGDESTVTMSPTRAGMILGTAAYMSPEQARGKPVDKRADIWAFGVVLYEMLTGRRLFEGETVSDVLAAVLTKEPQWNRIPVRTQRLLRRCLEKDPQRRLRDIGDAMPLVEEVAPAVLPSANKKSLWAAWAVAGVLGVALGVAEYRHAAEEKPRVLRFTVPPPGKTTFEVVNNVISSVPALSPDGRHLAFVANEDGRNSLWVRDLDSMAARALPGTDGALDPFWSPDSRVIAFFAGGKLKKIEVAGGPSVTVCDTLENPRGGSWNQADFIVFASQSFSGLSRVAAAGGTATPLTQLDQTVPENSHRFPWFLPDGRHFLYLARSGTDPGKDAVYLGDLNSKTRQRVAAVSSNAVYVPGYLLFLREQTLMAQPFDAAKARTTGDAVPIADQVDYIFSNRQAEFSASQNGVLAYTSGASGATYQLTWMDRSGKVLGTLGAPGGFSRPAISPDGNTVAVDRRDPGSGLTDVWLYDMMHGTNSRFTLGPQLGPQINDAPVWSPDGGHIAFRANRDGVSNVYRRATTGAAQEEALDKAPRAKFPTDWSRDGRYIVEEMLAASSTLDDIWVFPLFGDRKPFPYLQTEFNERFAKLSPNGQWLAYQSDESRRYETYVQTFPKPGGKWQVSTNGGERPVWSRDGKELFYLSADGKMMAVEIKGGQNFERGAPKPLFDVRLNAEAWFDVGKDGRFLVPVQIEQAASAPMTVVVNWTAGLKK
jgi:Tol biopolymer transport system component/predicted Ser/Thr protein kinase